MNKVLSVIVGAVAILLLAAVVFLILKGVMSNAFR